MSTLPTRRRTPSPIFRSGRAILLLACLFPLLAAGEPSQGAPNGSPTTTHHGIRTAPAPISPVRAYFPEGTDRVEVPFRSTLNKILLPVSINGAGPFDFVLDTGAATALLHSQDHPEDLELDIFAASRIVGAGKGEGQKSSLARSVTLDIGGVELRQRVLAVAPTDSSIARIMGSLWDGVFGRQLFERAVVEVDWQAQVVRLHRTETFRPPAGATAIPLVTRRGHVFAKARLAVDATTTHSVDLVVDTGAYHAIALAGKARPDSHLEGIMLGRGLNGEIRGDAGRIPELRLGPYTLNGVIASFPDAELAPVITSRSDGNLGNEILRRFTVTFDYRNERMWLVPNRHFEDPFAFSTSGIRPHPRVGDDGLLRIDDVYPGSPAANAGIDPGDRLVAIEGRNVTDIAIDRIHALLEGQPGKFLALKVERAGTIRQIRFRLKRLL